MSLVHLLFVFLWYFILVSLLVVPLWKTTRWFPYLVWMGLFYFCMLLTSILCFPFVLIRPGQTKNHLIVGWIFLKLTGWMGITWEIRGMENFTENQVCVIMCNHQSSIDLMGMMEMWPDGKTVALIKKSLLYAGMFGISATLSGSVFIDRHNTENAVRNLAKTCVRVRHEQLKLWVFPEGKRFHGRGMLPFKKGAFHLAVQAQIPVVPVVFSCYDSFYSQREFRFSSRGLVIVQVMPPIPTEGMGVEDVTRLSEDTREAMLGVFHEISLEADKRNSEGDF